MPTILVVDDEVVLAEVIQRMLKRAGYHVLLAANGREALQRVAEARPDLVLSDVMMPVLNGIELCRALAADPTYQTIPVVLMTAGHANLLSNDGHAVATLGKPFDYALLLATIAQYVRQTEGA